MRISRTVTWTDPKAIDAGDEALMQAALASKESNRDRMAELKELAKKQEPLIKKMVEAGMKKDNASVKKYERELKPIQDRMKALSDEISKPTDTAIARAEAVKKDGTVEFRLTGNLFYVWSLRPRPLKSPHPGALAFRTDPQTTAVFLGKAWKKTGDGVTAKTASANINTRFQTIVVQIKADESRAARIASQIDWAELMELMK
jgi:hypothetical protein